MVATGQCSAFAYGGHNLSDHIDPRTDVDWINDTIKEGEPARDGKRNDFVRTCIRKIDVSIAKFVDGSDRVQGIEK